MGITLTNPLLSQQQNHQVPPVSQGCVCVHRAGSGLADESGGTVWARCVSVCVRMRVWICWPQDGLPPQQLSQMRVWLSPAESNLWFLLFNSNGKTMCNWTKTPSAPASHLCFYTRSTQEAGNTGVKCVTQTACHLKVNRPNLPNQEESFQSL